VTDSGGSGRTQDASRRIWDVSDVQKDVLFNGGDFLLVDATDDEEKEENNTTETSRHERGITNPVRDIFFLFFLFYFAHSKGFTI
jgi:hypothetical protein